MVIERKKDLKVTTNSQIGFDSNKTKKISPY